MAAKVKARRAPQTWAAVAVSLAIAAVLLCGGCRHAHRPGGYRDPAGEMNPAAREAFELVNLQRSARNLVPLKINARCVAAAQSHAENQAWTRTLSHDGLTESFPARMRRWGLLRWAVAENIGRGPTASAVVDAWMGSPPHRASLLNPAYASGAAGFAGDTYILCLSGDSGD